MKLTPKTALIQSKLKLAANAESTQLKLEGALKTKASPPKVDPILRLTQG